MSQPLYTGLRAQGVNFDDDYHTWNKRIMIQKILTVMGLDCDCPDDPDPTYVLTVDNLIKILAIQMRFRYNLPLVKGILPMHKEQMVLKAIKYTVPVQVNTHIS